MFGRASREALSPRSAHARLAPAMAPRRRARARPTIFFGRSDVMSLEHLGYNESIAQRFGPFTERGLLPARIVRQDQRYVVRSSTGEWEAEVSGRFRHEAASREAFPVIGDWVAID